MPRTTIVVPCFNEVRRLAGARFVEAIDRDPRTDFLFVDDGSGDATLPRLQFLAAERPGRIGWMRLDHNRGKGEAVRRGICTALDERPEYVGFWDADLATPLDEIPRFREILDRRPEAQVVIGTRLPLLGRRLVRKRSRRMLGRLFAWCASRILGLPIVDTQCGAKLFRVGPATRELFDRPFLSRWIFDVELFARLAATQDAAAETIYELPLENWSEIAGSRLRPTDFLRAVAELAAIRWRYCGLNAKSRDVTIGPLDRPDAIGRKPAPRQPMPRAVEVGAEEERQAA